MNKEQMNIGQIAYEAYVRYLDKWNAPSIKWADLNATLRAAWEAAATAVRIWGR